MFHSLREKYRERYQKHERYKPIAFFMLGFVFDALMLHRIDEPFVLVQQFLYLVLIAAFVGVELVEQARGSKFEFASGSGAKVWKHREAILHFLMGTLLNSYTIFYFKSASALTSFLFIGLLIALLMINEFKRFGQSQTKVHVAFLSLCLISYLVALLPIALGFVGTIPFLLANAVAAAAFYGYWRLLKPRLLSLPTGKEVLRNYVLKPFVGVQAVFAILYFAHLIPPVPLSVTYMGIYHDIQKQDGRYLATYTRSKWYFWQHGDQYFHARPGDSVYCFVQIFSPSRFNDTLQVRWSYKDPRQGWMPADAIPLPVVGGREEGFRALTKKSNYTPGDWRVQIETKDGREIGRLDLTIVADTRTEPVAGTTLVF